MAYNPESMDVDCVDSDFDNKENTYHHNNVLPCTEKGYEELDVSELNMKLRYSITPVASPMSKSYTAYSDSKHVDFDDLLNRAVENNLTRSLNSTITQNDGVAKSLKTLPLQSLSTGHDRNSTVLRPLDTTITDTNNDTITLNNAREIDENISLPSTSSSMTHTPEATTPVNEPKNDNEGSPIMRGLKTVLNMFRASQSPIPPPDTSLNLEISSLDTTITAEKPTLMSTPIAAHRSKEGNTSRKGSPLKESITFNEDLETELQWKDDTVLFSDEKIPIHKLMLPNTKPLPKAEMLKPADNLNTTVEFMDISYNDSMMNDKTLSEVKTDAPIDENVSIAAAESDGEFVDCETTLPHESRIQDSNTNESKDPLIGVVAPKINTTQTIDQLEGTEFLEIITDNNLSLKVEQEANSTVSIIEELDNLTQAYNSKKEGNSLIVSDEAIQNLENREPHDITQFAIGNSEKAGVENKCSTDSVQKTDYILLETSDNTCLAENVGLLVDKKIEHEVVCPAVGTNLSSILKNDLSSETQQDILVLNEAECSDSKDKYNTDVIEETRADIVESIETEVVLTTETQTEKQEDTHLINDIETIGYKEACPTTTVTNATENITTIIEAPDTTNSKDLPSAYLTELMISDEKNETTITEIRTDNPNLTNIQENQQQFKVENVKPADVPLPDENDINKEFKSDASQILSPNTLDITEIVQPKIKLLDVSMSMEFNSVVNDEKLKIDELNSTNIISVNKQNEDTIITNEVEPIHNHETLTEFSNLPDIVNQTLPITNEIQKIEVQDISDETTIIGNKGLSTKEGELKNVNLPTSYPDGMKTTFDNVIAVEIIESNEAQIPMPVPIEAEACNSHENFFSVHPDTTLCDNIEVTAVEATKLNEDHKNVLIVQPTIIDTPFENINSTAEAVENIETKPISIGTDRTEQDYHKNIRPSLHSDIMGTTSDNIQSTTSLDTIDTNASIDCFENSKKENKENFTETTVVTNLNEGINAITDKETVCSTNLTVVVEATCQNNIVGVIKENITLEDKNARDAIGSAMDVSKHETPLDVTLDFLTNKANLTDIQREISNNIATEEQTVVTQDFLDRESENTSKEVCQKTVPSDIINSNTEEIIVSENNSPYVSVMAEIQTETGVVEDNFEKIENSTTVPSSPPIVSKGYNFNFDDIDDPFATKTKIRQSPTPNTPGRDKEPDDTSNIDFEMPKKAPINRRKSQPAERKKFSINKKKHNATIVSKLPKDEEKNTAILERKTENKSITDMVEAIGKVEKDVQDIDIQKLEENEFQSFEMDKRVPKSFSELSTTSVDVKTSSSEQSTYYSATASSTESSTAKNVFNLPEIEDRNFNPFATKSKMRLSPPPLDIEEDPFVTKSKIGASPETSMSLTNDIIDKPCAEVEDKMDVELMEKDVDLSTNTTSSKVTDEKTLSPEINTEDEDTEEGPFIEAEDAIEKTTILGDSEFTCLPTQQEDNLDAGELFIDAEAFEFLLNQNQTNVVTDSGKESLFLKFDPLFSKRISFGGQLNQAQKRQSTLTKTEEGSLKNETSSIAGPSNATFNLNTSNLNITADESNEDLNITIAKPTMIVTPAVNPAVTPRNNSTIQNRTNRLSSTITSPAMAVIDRLLSMSANNSLMDAAVTPIKNEANVALTQLRELLAEKEIDVYNLKAESIELKDRLNTMETQVKVLETESEERLKKINESNIQLAKVSKINKSMAVVVEEYERTISSLIADMEQDKKRHAEERMQLINDRDEQTAHLSSMEVTFNDLHSKYEKSKQVILNFKANEESFQKSIKVHEESLTKMQKNYEMLKQHATSKLNHANQELEKINKAHEAEVLKLKALLKKNAVAIKSLEESLAQKTKANEDLAAICEEILNKVG